LRWLLLIGLAAVAMIYGWLYRKEIVASLRELIAAWLAWFSPRGGDAPSADAGGQQDPELRPSFAGLANPFITYRSDPDQIVRHLFDATVVWGSEHRVERREDETPEEFLRRLGRKYSDVAEPLAQLGMIYSRLAYAQTRVPSEKAHGLRPLWEWMSTHPVR